MTSRAADVREAAAPCWHDHIADSRAVAGPKSSPTRRGTYAQRRWCFGAVGLGTAEPKNASSTVLPRRMRTGARGDCTFTTGSPSPQGVRQAGNDARSPEACNRASASSSERPWFEGTETYEREPPQPAASSASAPSSTSRLIAQHYAAGAVSGHTFSSG